MLYLNLPLEYYVTILYILIVSFAVIGFYYIRKITDTYIKIILIWTVILFEINFLNMLFTLKNYLRNSKKKGNKGNKGERGPRGLNGFNNLCNLKACQKKLGVKNIKETFGGNVNDEDKVVDDVKLKIGKCVFPFIHNHTLNFECVTSDWISSNGKTISAPSKGWCATEVNSDLTVKKFGYCNKSEEFLMDMQNNDNREERLNEYLKENYGITQLKIISGVTSDIKCPSGYTKIDKDLNSGTDGKFVYLCKKIEVADKGIGDFKIFKNIDKCPEEVPLMLRGNINEGISSSSDLKICVNKVETDFITDIIVKDNNDPIEGYKIATDMDLNEGLSDEQIYIFYSKDMRPGLVIDTAFVWDRENAEDSRLYFFKENMYWKFNTKNNLEKEYPQEVSSRWGNLPHRIDASFKNPFDNSIYFFDGSLYYEYDSNNLKIKDGYPKKIIDYWNGVPEKNIDAVFVDKDKQVHFVKDKFIYLWNNNDKSVSKVDTLDTIWENAPVNISSMFYFNNNVYITQVNKVYIYDSNTKKLDSHSPKNISDVFKGI